ncbi:MAG: hypothetical protein K1W05_07025 [Desulfovibrio sp.]
MKIYRVAGRSEYGRYETYEEASAAAIIKQNVDPTVSIQYWDGASWIITDNPVEDADEQEEAPRSRSAGDNSAKIISRLADKMNRIGHPRPEDA